MPANLAQGSEGLAPPIDRSPDYRITRFLRPSACVPQPGPPPPIGLDYDSKGFASFDRRNLPLNHVPITSNRPQTASNQLPNSIGFGFLWLVAVAYFSKIENATHTLRRGPSYRTFRARINYETHHISTKITSTWQLVFRTPCRPPRQKKGNTRK
jgi:hypothetical protein